MAERLTQRGIIARWGPPFLIAALASALGWSVFAARERSTDLMQAMALQGTSLQATSMEAARHTYSEEVIAPLKARGISIAQTANPHGATLADVPAIPLPVTLLNRIGEHVTAVRPGAALRLVSDFPFPATAATRPALDDFQNQALEALRTSPDQPFYRFETMGGVSVLRYAIADRMSASCVECHNTHPQSPKRDWMIGDVRGILEVVRPINDAGAHAATARARLDEVFVVLSGLVICGMLALTYIAWNSRRTSMLSLAATLTRSGVVFTDRHWRIIWANNPFLDRLGCTLSEAKGRLCDHFRQCESIDPDAMARPQWSLCSGQEARLETFLRTEDGRGRWFDLEIQPMRGPGGWIDGVVAVETDITERKQMEDDLRRERDRAESASRAKSEFLAHMSHEIRTPLNGMMGMTELLLGTSLTDQQRRYGQLAKISAESLIAVINDILDFSKIEAGRLEIVPTDFNLRHAVEDIMEVLAQRAVKNGIEISCHVDPTVPILVRGDCDRLRQIIINLVNNAIKFTERGSVVVHVAPTSSSDERTTLRFEVADTGIGIPRDRIDRLFKAFSQADASTTRVYGGTGLGLVISKQLAELMGGTIGVESEPGRGSRFWFTIVVETPSQPASPRSRAHIDARTLRVLAVDDNDVQRDVLVQQVASWGVDAAAARDGEEALAKLSEAVAIGLPYRVALVDRDMPGMDGFSLAAAIKARTDLRQTVLLILVTLDEDIDPERLRAMGFAGHMTKPVRQSMIFDAIMNAIAAAEQNPVQAPLQMSGGSIPTPLMPGSGARILLAEDNEINQIVALEILTKFGYRCDVVPDGGQAVDAVQHERYDVVLMDCQMPVMDGFEATRKIRRLEENGTGRRLSIIALTANAMSGDRERCFEAGMDGYTCKPIDPKELLRTIEQVLRTQRAAPEAA